MKVMTIFNIFQYEYWSSEFENDLLSEYDKFPQCFAEEVHIKVLESHVEAFSVSG